MSNVFTYPLDLIITRLQTQRHLRKENSKSRDDEYQNIKEAVLKIYNQEGGLTGFYTGLLQDTAKTILDSFFFFLVYNFLRQRRFARFAKHHGGRTPSLLPAVDELGIGFIAGSLTKLVTTPISNVVTRKQTSTMVPSAQTETEDAKIAEKAGSGGAPEKTSVRVKSTRQIVQEIQNEKGLLGFWSGYSASLILTLNPSLTFFLFEALKRLLLPRSKRDSPPASATFFLAAISKALATSVTYPFSLTKARMQASGTTSHTSSYPPSEAETPTTSSPTPSPSYKKQPTIFHTLLTLATTEGPSSLYEGLPLDLLKGFLSHGTTMLLKQSIHSIVLKLYFSLSLLVSSLSYTLSGSKARSKTLLARRRREAAAKGKDYYDMAVDRAGEVAEGVQGIASNVGNAANNVYESGKAGVAVVRDKASSGTAAMWDGGKEEGGEMMREVMQMANETVELVRDYVGVGDDDEGE